MSNAFAFDLSPAALRHAESFKWAQYADDVIPLWVADMDFAVAPSIVQRLRDRLDRTVGYHPMAADMPLTVMLREKLAGQGFGELPGKGAFGYLGNVVSGLYASVMGLTAPGEEVISFTPIYPPFMSAMTDCGRVPKYVPLLDTNEGWRIDWDALEASVSPATRLLMLCNPHNPTGRVWTVDELTRLADFVARHRLWAVTDDLHADLTLDGPYTPLAAVAGPDVRQRIVTLTGPCKSYNTAGLGIGVMFSHSVPLIARCKRMTHGIAAHPAAMAVTMWQAALEDDGAWLAAVLDQLRSNRDFLSQFVRERLPGVRYFGPEATYLAWLDYRQHPRAADIQKYLLATAKVALIPGGAMGAGFEGYVRLNFATSRATLSEALERMAAAHVPQ